MICCLFTFTALVIALVIHNEANLTAVEESVFAIGAAFCTVIASGYIQDMKTRIDKLNKENEAIKNALSAVEKEVFKEKKDD